ncbi:MAG: hypothetical protein AAB589_01880 [Patescibacteria group bacterium]
MTLQFAILDPRNIPTAAEANDKVFANPVYGIEVTVPALAKRCIANLDPQHTGGDANRAAIEDALTAELPTEGSTLATVRADLDAVGAMVVFGLRLRGRMIEPSAWRVCSICGAGLQSCFFVCGHCGWVVGSHSNEAVATRFQQVAAADKFARGGWLGPKPLPTKENPWPSEGAADSTQSLAAIAAAVTDFKVPMADRVATMEKWLLTGEEPKQYRDSVEKERLDMIAALESGAIRCETRSGGKIAVVESTHRAATSVGYSLAPVVVARNPAFKLGGGEAHAKYTVCAFEAGKFADIKSALAELATIEAGWGGSPVIGGSPQGVSSALTIDQVVEVVEKHLK